MTDIPAELVRQLREVTGAGLMDCKRALQETAGDLEAAVKLLRERGMAQAAKRAGRETTEGIVISTIAGTVGAMVAVGCETEPVSKNEEFLRFAERVLETTEAGGDVAPLEAERTELIARIGENVVIVGTVCMETADGEGLAEYVHPPANKIGVLLKFRGGTPQLARQLAMHISFARPRYAVRDEVPADAVAAERDILVKQPDVASKPENVQEKIVEGRLEKWFAESVLADQEWIHDTSKTVADALAEGSLAVLEFERFALAE
jgi:elongation factor Ts